MYAETRTIKMGRHALKSLMAEYVSLFSHHRDSGGSPEQPGGRADRHHRPEHQQDKTAPSLTATHTFSVTSTGTGTGTGEPLALCVT